VAPRVSSYMTKEVIVVRPSDTLAHVRRLMLRNTISRVVVVDENNRPVGIVTLTDLVKSILWKYSTRPLNAITVEEVMTRDLKTVTPRRSIKYAAEQMLRYKIGGLPVVGDDGTLLGIITRTDLARAYADHYAGDYTVGDLARPIYAKAHPYHAIYHVAKLIELDPAGKVVVVDEAGRPVGIITKWDLAFTTIPLEIMSTRGKDRMRKRKVRDPYGGDKIVTARSYFVPLAKDVMSSEVITITPEVDAAEAARIMVENDIGALPVVNKEGVAEKLITKIELMKAIVQG